MTTDHVHAYRIMATALADRDHRRERVGFDPYMSPPPQYPFICPCGDTVHMSLESAAWRGLVAILDLDRGVVESGLEMFTGKPARPVQDED